MPENFKHEDPSEELPTKELGEKKFSEELLRKYLDEEKRKILQTEEGRESAKWADNLLEYVKKRKSEEKSKNNKK